jgi:hypothetical protein
MRSTEGITVLKIAADLVAVVGLIFGLYAVVILVLSALALTFRRRGR